MAQYTPMMQQYLDVKKEHEDCILLYRLGDFYEMFFEDAKVVSQELDLTLTGRDCGQEERAPMCGVPYHSAESYIARLIQKGYKVAICEQTEDPAQAKGLVRREVIRKITPGTVIESSMLEEGKNNFICGVYLDSAGAGVCFCDMSTGETSATEFIEGDLEGRLCDELSRFAPSEVVLSDAAYSSPRVMAFIKDRLSCHVEQGGEWRFAEEGARQAVRAQFSGEDCQEVESCAHLIRAAGGLLSYLHETQKNGLSHISRLDRYEQGMYMELDLTARRNLELTATLRGEKRGSLLWVVDHTRTAMGARLLRQWLEKPLLSVSRIKQRQRAVQAMAQDVMGRDELRELLSQVLDIERTMGRIVYGTANARDLRALCQVCGLLPGLKARVAAFEAPYCQTLSGQIDELGDLYQLICSAICEDPPFSVREGGMLQPGYSEEADKLRELLGGGTGRMAAIEQNERERTGIKNLKVGYNKVFGYYIEVTKSNIGQVPPEYVRKQTLTNCERYITQELKILEGEVLSASERLTALEYQLFCQVREQVAAQVARVQATGQAIAAVDAICSFATAADRYQYVCPDMDYSDRLDIRAGRHPVVERVLKDSLFVPNDAQLDCGENRVAIITGPNMAGKSTYMRQVALIAVMAQCGSFVPADSASLGVVDRVFTRVGASDDLFAGRSTFMVEMNEVADILRHATSKSLLILDEIGRGTSTYDGMSIARAVLEYAADRKVLGAKTLFATHYHELCELEGQLDGVKNYNVVVKKRGDDIVFIKKIVRGGANDSYGIEVGKLAGLPDRVIRRAKAILKDIEGKVPASGRSAPAEEPMEDQVSLGSYAGQELVERLKAMHPDTLTPIEALTTLYELCQKAKEA